MLYFRIIVLPPVVYIAHYETPLNLTQDRSLICCRPDFTAVNFVYRLSSTTVQNGCSFGWIGATWNAKRPRNGSGRCIPVGAGQGGTGWRTADLNRPDRLDAAGVALGR